MRFSPFSLRAGVFTILLNRPKVKNALNLAMYQGLVDALAAAAKDPACVVAVITGAGMCAPARH
jgi:2-(1,2-epoxy-1,2-dihydrophenyl)acetyl-CoA isomerase